MIQLTVILITRTDVLPHLKSGAANSTNRTIWKLLSFGDIHVVIIVLI
jgi:hypothetical protein